MMATLLSLFGVFLRIGVVTVGGGYAMLPLIRSELVRRGWMDDAMFLDILAIAEMTPGPIAINSATFVGLRVGGAGGGTGACER
jgi:chromate transporter